MAADDFLSAVRRLSSGLRIVTASDDEGGLSASQQTLAQKLGAQMASLNACQAMLMSQAGQNNLSAISSVLQRMRVLAIQAASDGMSSEDRANVQEEFERLLMELDRLGRQDGAGQLAVDGSAGGAQVAIMTAHIISVAAQAGAESAATRLDDAIRQVTVVQSNLAAVLSRMGYAMNGAEAGQQQAAQALSHLQDADVAQEVARAARDQILTQSGSSILAQANQASAPLLRLLK